MKSLNWDYETVCVKYQKLVQRREQVNMSEKVDVEAMTTNLKIVGAPKKSPSSSYLKQLLRLSNVLLMDLVTRFRLASQAFYIKPIQTFSLNYYGYRHCA